MDTKIILETPRLVLRWIIPEDGQNMYELNEDWEVLKYTGDKRFENIKAAIDFYTAYHENTYVRWGYGRFATIEKHSGDIIGWCGLKYHPDEDEVDLGFRFHQKFWNKGYGTESSMACLEYGRDTLNLKRVVANAMRPNIGSIRVLEKCGFTFEKEIIYDEKEWLRYGKIL